MLLLPTAGDISISSYLCDFSILAHVSFRLTDRLNTSLLSEEVDAVSEILVLLHFVRVRLGEKKSVQDTFRITGTSHVIAISG